MRPQKDVSPNEGSHHSDELKSAARQCQMMVVDDDTKLPLKFQLKYMQTELVSGGKKKPSSQHLIKSRTPEEV